MRVTIAPATIDQQSLIESLLQDYLQGFATFSQVERQADGRFEYPYLKFYWQDPDRYPFLILADENVAGFALIRRDRDPASGIELMEMAEFYVMDEFRRAGIGGTAAQKLWQAFPGNWLVRVLISNEPAIAFWRQLIKKTTHDQLQEVQNRELDIEFTFSINPEPS